MNLVVYAAIVLIFMGLCGCENTPPQGPLPDLTLSSVNNSIGYCYQTSQTDLAETIEFQVEGDRIKGQGVRTELETQQQYRLTFEGTRSGNTAEVTIQATGITPGDENHYTHREQWTFGDEHLHITNREVRGFKSSYVLKRIACSLYPNEDTTLYTEYTMFVDGYAVVAKDGWYGIVNADGELVVPTSYRDLSIPSKGYSVFFDENTGLRGMINMEGDLVLESKYVEITSFSEGLAAFLDDEEGLWGFMNTNLEIVIPPQFYSVNFHQMNQHSPVFSEGLANVQMPNNLWNYIDKKGNVKIAGDFIYTEPFQNGQARVYKNNQWYYIDKMGKCVENCDK